MNNGVFYLPIVLVMHEKCKGVLKHEFVKAIKLFATNIIKLFRQISVCSSVKFHLF